jgi:hypothetical protein
MFAGMVLADVETRDPCLSIVSSGPTYPFEIAEQGKIPTEVWIDFATTLSSCIYTSHSIC